MISPSGTCSSVAFASLSSLSSLPGLPSLMNGDLHRGARDLEAGGVEVTQDCAVDAVLDLADAVLGDDEPDGELEPVVGQRPEHARLERLVLEPVLAFEIGARPG